MFDTFFNAYDMSLLVMFFERDYLNGILNICLFGAAFILVIAVTRKLIALFKGTGEVEYKSLLLRTALSVALLALYPTLYIGAIRFNDEILLTTAVQIQEKEALTNSVNQLFGIFDVKKAEEYRRKRLAIFDDEFFEKKDESFIEKGEEKKEEKKSLLQRLLDGLGIMDRLVANLTTDAFITGIVVFLSNVLLFFFSIVRSVLLTMYFFLGPFLITLNIDDTSSPYFTGYLQSVLNVLLWPWIQLLILLLMDIVLESMNYRGFSDSLVVCSTHLALLYLLLKSMTFIPDLKRGRAGLDSGMVASNLINTGLRAASVGAKSAIGTALPSVAPYLGAKGAGKFLGERFRSLGSSIHEITKRDIKEGRRR